MVRYGELLATPADITTMSRIFDRYQREVVSTKAPRTQKDNLRELGLLRRAFGHMPPEDITPQDIYAFIDARQAPVRANREKALLSHVFRYAIRWGNAATNPCQLVSRNPERPRSRYVEDHEFQTVYDLALPVIRVAMELAYITGLRQGDILSLRLQNVTEQGLRVVVGKTRSRTGRALLFEWTKALREAVEAAKQLRHGVRSMYLICTRTGQRYSSSGFQAMWRRTMGKAIEEKRLAERFTFHDLRAKAGSDSEDDGLLGHEDSRTLRRYYKRKPLKVTPLTPKILDNR